MDVFHFGLRNKDKISLIEMAETFQQHEANNHSKAPTTLEFRTSSSSHNLSLDQFLDMKEEWILGVTKLRVHNTFHNSNE